MGWIFIPPIHMGFKRRKWQISWAKNLVLSVFACPACTAFFGVFFRVRVRVKD
jgi:hypothetical protein